MNARTEIQPDQIPYIVLKQVITLVNDPEIADPYPVTVQSPTQAKGQGGPLCQVHRIGVIQEKKLILLVVERRIYMVYMT